MLACCLFAWPCDFWLNKKQQKAQCQKHNRGREPTKAKRERESVANNKPPQNLHLLPIYTAVSKRYVTLILEQVQQICTNFFLFISSGHWPFIVTTSPPLSLARLFLCAITYYVYHHRHGLRIIITF